MKNLFKKIWAFGVVLIIILFFWGMGGLKWSENLIRDRFHGRYQASEEFLLLDMSLNEIKENIIGLSKEGEAFLLYENFFQYFLKFRPKVLVLDEIWVDKIKDVDWYDEIKSVVVEALSLENVEQMMMKFDFDDLNFKIFRNVFMDEDGVVRKNPVLVKDEFGKIYLNLAIKVWAKIRGLEFLKVNDELIKFDDGSEFKVNNGYIELAYPKVIENGLVKYRKMFASEFIALNEDEKRKLIEGKTVLFLPIVDSNRNKFKLPGNYQGISELEALAASIQALTEGKVLREVGIWWEIGLFLVGFWGILAVVEFVGLRIGGIVLIVFFIVIYFGAGWLFELGWLLNIVPSFIGSGGAFIGGILIKYIDEKKKKEKIQKSFGKYLNPVLVKELARKEEAVKLGGEERFLTMMFSDLVSFTSLSEKMPAELLVKFLNMYFSVMTKIIIEEGGVVDKFEGDAIMAFFGAPIELPNNARAAMRAALKMRIKMNEFVKELPEEFLKFFEGRVPAFRLGINSGKVIVGNIGSEERLEYTVIGDSVNLASRLEGVNKKYKTRLIVAESTVNHLGEDHEFLIRTLDKIRVVGKKEPVKIYELLAFKSDVSSDVLDMINEYEEGIKFYFAKEFLKAFEIFKQLTEKFPQDGPCLLYKQRTDVLKDVGVKDGWDGTFDLKEK